MRLRVIFIVSSILCVVMCIIMINYKQGMKYEVPKIKFPELAGGNDYEFDIVNKVTDEKVENIENDEVLNSFYILNENIDNKAVQKICNKFNINNQTKKIFDNQITYGTDNILTVYDNGCLDFYTIEGTPLCNVSVSDEECKRLANEIINELGIFPEGYTFYGIVYGTCNDLEKPEDQMIISKEVVFTREVDNIDVYGNSKVSVKITDEGTIQSITVNSRNIEKKETFNEINTINEAIENLKNYDGYINIPEGSTKLIIDDVKICYWEDSTIENGNNTIQPVYEFTGKAYDDQNELGEFTILESVMK